MQTIRRHPIIILLVVNILIGLFIFRDYGLSWDEPLFYDYADALGYAYSPAEWFSGNFNLENAYGSSGTDHANRGPAYILLAREPVYLLQSFGLDNASAWHLVNFLTFQLGVYFLYRLALRWAKPWPAFAAAALFSTQPLFWGHAFINPKDTPFLVFFLASVCLGFEMVDRWADASKSDKRKILAGIFPAILLGIATSIRVLGPLAGLLVALYTFARRQVDTYTGKQVDVHSTQHASRNTGRKSFQWLIVYAIITAIIAFIAWPYLWTNPIQRFIEAFGFMSDNPTQLKVLFNGELYQADELPRRYLPVLLGTTLTEPVWILFILGFILAIWKQIASIRNNQSPITNYKSLLTDPSALRQAQDNALLRASSWSLITEYSFILLWFIIPFAYVIIRKPPMYDGYRHFLFMLPPVFLISSLVLDKLLEIIQTRWLAIAVTALILAPGVVGIAQLHPFEYAYYNSFVGGTGGASRTYETDYWLTCYKQAVEQFNSQAPQNVRLFVKREPYIAAYYASPGISIHDYRAEFSGIQTGDYVLVNTRANEDEKTFKDAPVILQIGRGNAQFCVIKRIP
ncbi:MAG: hypothetical protein HZB19_09970 [Chloroflexi bacterium]|nr:hypothetical protein [Chloroflexota bacterium]